MKPSFDAFLDELIRVKLAFQTSQFSGPLSMGSFKMTSHMPAFQQPGPAVKEVSPTELRVDPRSSSPMVKRAGEETPELTPEEIAKNRETLLGLGATGVGGLVAKNSKSRITGRTRLYHGTAKKNVKTIQQEGIAVGKDGISSILRPEVAQQAAGQAYLTETKSQARGYAAQAEAIAPAFAGGAPNHSLLAQLQRKSLQAQLAAEVNPFANAGVVTADVPLWRPEIESKLRVNPEVAAPYDEWVKKQYPDPMVDYRATYDELRNKTRVFEGGLSPEYIHGGNNYKRLGLSEIAEYAHARPGRFASGVGMLAGGTALGALGAHTMYKNMQTPEAPVPEAKTAAGMGANIPTVASPKTMLSRTMRVGTSGSQPQFKKSIQQQVSPNFVGKGSATGPAIPGATQAT